MPFATGSTVTTTGGGVGTVADFTASGTARSATLTFTAFFDTCRSSCRYVSIFVVSRRGSFTPSTSS